MTTIWLAINENLNVRQTSHKRLNFTSSNINNTSPKNIYCSIHNTSNARKWSTGAQLLLKCVIIIVGKGLTSSCSKLSLMPAKHHQYINHTKFERNKLKKTYGFRGLPFEETRTMHYLNYPYPTRLATFTIRTQFKVQKMHL